MMNSFNLTLHIGNTRHCIVVLSGRDQRGNTCSALGWHSDTSPTAHKQIRPFWCWFPGEWVCVRSRTLRVFPVNFPVRLGVSPATTNCTGFIARGFEVFFSSAGTLGCAVCLTPQLFLLVYLHANVRPPGLPSTASLAHHLHLGFPSPPLLPVWMNVSSLTPWLPDLLSEFNFWQFWLFSVFKFVVVLLLVVRAGKVYVSTYASILARSLRYVFLCQGKSPEYLPRNTTVLSNLPCNIYRNKSTLSWIP